MGEAAKRWNEAIENPSKLVADNDHLAGELAASMRREQEIWMENQKLKDDISDYEIEMRDRSDAAEKLARELNTERMQRKEYESLAKSLEKELAAAPRWVPVAEFDNDLKFHIVWDADEEEVFDAKLQKRSGAWLAAYSTERCLNVTHVLVGLNPPVIERDVDPRGDGDIEEVTPDTDVKLSTEQMTDTFDKMIDVTKLADEDAIRERLLRPFYGSEAEKLGAKTYQLRDGELWEYLKRGVEWDFVDGLPCWFDDDTYRLAIGEQHAATD